MNKSFEYGVILNGSQTNGSQKLTAYRFEYGVILNGSQTKTRRLLLLSQFEYGVILNGSQKDTGVVAYSVVCGFPPRRKFAAQLKNRSGLLKRSDFS